MFNKPIIATTLSGLFIRHDPWEQAHILWFAQAANDLRDPNVEQLAFKQPYFPWVDQIMKRMYPKLSDKERTIKARERFFEAVCSYIKQNPSVINKEAVDYFKELKKRVVLALITTNTSKALETIIPLAKLQGFFDLKSCSLPEEKDDKALVFDRFIQRNGEPALYIGGDRKDSYTFCQERGIPCVYASFQQGEDIPGVDVVYSLEDLKSFIEGILKGNY